MPAQIDVIEMLPCVLGSVGLISMPTTRVPGNFCFTSTPVAPPPHPMSSSVPGGSARKLMISTRGFSVVVRIERAGAEVRIAT